MYYVWIGIHPILLFVPSHKERFFFVENSFPVEGKSISGLDERDNLIN